jgi:hypothetical protein
MVINLNTYIYIRRNLVKRNTFCIYSPHPFYSMFCSTHLSSAKWQMKKIVVTS